MSCNYADGLSPYEDKGILGVPEKFENIDNVNSKCELLAEWILKARHVVVHTGAGISTSAGIPDFRGPNGVWTLEKEGKKPNINISFNEAIPTKTHMALKQLVDSEYIRYVVSQNIDGLHLRSGMKRKYLSELHGNMFVEQCNACDRQFVRTSATTTVGRKFTGSNCRRLLLNSSRSCRGKLRDTILDWEDKLPDNDLSMADYHSCVADLCLCLGTTLQIIPSGNLPLNTKKYGGKLVIVNLQPTKYDKKADLLINTYVDDVLTKVMKRLGLEIPSYTSDLDPTTFPSESSIMEWTLEKNCLAEVKQLYNIYCKNYRKRKLEEKKKSQNKVLKIEESFNVINKSIVDGYDKGKQET